MEKATLIKIFLVSFFLILLGQGSNGLSCNEDDECISKGLVCEHEAPVCCWKKCYCPVCDIRTRTCSCPTTYHGQKVLETNDKD
ncbi:hypothetical protein P3L10_033444 [Capsicum annuum]